MKKNKEKDEQQELRDLLWSALAAGLSGKSSPPSIFPPVRGFRKMAKDLRMSPATLLKLVHAGEIPAKKVGGVYFFDKIQVYDSLKARYELKSKTT